MSHAAPTGGASAGGHTRDYVLLMVDLSHFSEIVADRSAAEIHQILSACYAHSRSTIELLAPAARIEQYIGDAIVIAEPTGGADIGGAVSRLLAVARELIRSAPELAPGGFAAKAALAAGPLYRGPFGPDASGLVGAPLITLFRLEARVRTGCILLPWALYEASGESGDRTHDRMLRLRGVREEHFVELVEHASPDAQHTRRRLEKAQGSIAQTDARAAGVGLICTGVLGALLGVSATPGHRVLGVLAHVAAAVALGTLFMILRPRTDPRAYGPARGEEPCPTYYGDVPAGLAEFHAELKRIDTARLDAAEAVQAAVLEEIAQVKARWLRRNIGATLLAFVLVLAYVASALVAIDRGRPRYEDPGASGSSEANGHQGSDGSAPGETARSRVGGGPATDAPARRQRPR